MLHIASRHTYDVPRIHAELRRLGGWVNRKRVARVMREHDIRGVSWRKRRSLARPDVQAKPAPHLISRDFHDERPGTKLVGDITYLPTAEGWLYLACWLDLVTREIVGYAMADHSAACHHDPLRQGHDGPALVPGHDLIREHSDNQWLPEGPRGPQQRNVPWAEQVSNHVDVDVSALSHACRPLDGPKPTKPGPTAVRRQPSADQGPKRCTKARS